jgi:hypothetical protein
MTVAAIYYVGVTIRTITPDAQEGKIMSSLSFLFWAFLASYVVHILDETLQHGRLRDFGRGSADCQKDGSAPSYRPGGQNHPSTW